MKQLIDMRGGFETLLRDVPYLTSSLVIFVMQVFQYHARTQANPVQHCHLFQLPWAGYRTDQRHRALDKHIREVEKMYSLIFPYVLCPPSLFIEMIRINHLRQEITASPFENEDQHTLQALDILARVEAFVPEDWAQPGEHHDQWLLIGTIYQSAMALYCTMSLQSVAALPTNLEMNTMRTIHGERLLDALLSASQMRQVRKFSLFPLCVLGVEAGYHHDHSTRRWIEQRLEQHSRLLGTSSPLKARAVLRRYWQKGEPGWDECFDRPYVFLL